MTLIILIFILLFVKSNTWYQKYRQFFICIEILRSISTICSSLQYILYLYIFNATNEIKKETSTKMYTPF